MKIAALSAILSAAALLAAPQAAHARSVVSFDRENLTDPAQADALYRSVTQAANRACRLEYAQVRALTPFARRRATDRCTRETLANAVRAIDAPMIYARHERFIDSAKRDRLARRR